MGYTCSGIIYKNYLKHFGILGMKWGVRRYQNFDGTLTPEGKARYGKDAGFVDTKDLKEQIDKASEAYKLGTAIPIHKPGTYKNVDRVMKKLHEELEKTWEARDWHEAYAEALEENDLEGTMDAPIDWLMMNNPNSDLGRVYQAYNEAGRQIYEDNLEELSGAFLKDIGYDDTQLGRWAVADLLKDKY